MGLLGSIGKAASAVSGLLGGGQGGKYGGQQSTQPGGFMGAMGNADNALGSLSGGMGGGNLAIMIARAMAEGDYEKARMLQQQAQQQQVNRQPTDTFESDPMTGQQYFGGKMWTDDMGMTRWGS